MGSEDLFHKRKARNNSALERQKKHRTAHKRYLIVCEGTKTEPQYFQDVLEGLRIPPHLVRIARNNGSSPDKIVSHALQIYEDDAKLGDAFDGVYCVFDRDKHTTFDAAVSRTRDLKKAGKPFKSITSTPCFEVWLILHFSYYDSPFHAKGKKSVADHVISELKKRPGFKDYNKGSKGLYNLLSSKMDNAICNAEKLRKRNAEVNSINPETEVDKLIKIISGCNP